MGCCLISLVLIGAPRLAILAWWFFEPLRFTATFQTWQLVLAGWVVPLWVPPLVGFLLAPWTTLGYMWVAPGGVNGIEWAVLVIALLIDLGAHGGGGEAYKRRRSDS